MMSLCRYRLMIFNHFNIKYRSIIISHSINNKCQSCEKRFSTPWDCRRHELIHTNECDQCDFKTNVKWNLKAHKTVHLSSFLFRCSECDYGAHKNDTLDVHMMSKHLGLQPFECDQCDYKTANRSNLNKHKEIHSDSKRNLTAINAITKPI